MKLLHDWMMPKRREKSLSVHGSSALTVRVAPWQEYYKLFNKLIGSVDK